MVSQYKVSGSEVQFIPSKLQRPGLREMTLDSIRPLLLLSCVFFQIFAVGALFS